MQKKLFLSSLAGILALAIACGGDSKTPVSPTPAPAENVEAAADGTTLKVNAPALVTPVDNATDLDRQPTLVANASTGKFTAVTGLAYRFQVVNTAGQDVANAVVTGGATSTSYKIPSLLAYSTDYRWRARAEQGSLIGPWSGYFAFRTMVEPPPPPDPLENVGYFRANEVWDPLVKGVSVGQAINMEFIEGQGARTISNESRITYDLLQTLQAGEFSFYVYNLNPLSAGDKTKLMSMQEGHSDITTNDYRFTVEKRGVIYPIPGQVRIRIINGDSGNKDNIHDAVPFVPPLVKAKWYFVRLTWGSNRALFQIFNNDPGGSLIASAGVNYPGRQYGPVPHVAHVGAPVGRAGARDASVSNMTVKGVFIGGVGVVRPAGLGGGVVGDDFR